MRQTTLRRGASTLFLTVVVSIAAFGGIRAHGQGQQNPLASEQLREDVVLEVPAGVKLLKVAGDTIEIRQLSHVKNDTEVKLINGATLTWSNGIRLQVSSSSVVVLKALMVGPTRVVIQSSAKALK